MCARDFTREAELKKAFRGPGLVPAWPSCIFKCFVRAGCVVAVRPAVQHGPLLYVAGLYGLYMAGVFPSFRPVMAAFGVLAAWIYLVSVCVCSDRAA